MKVESRFSVTYFYLPLIIGVAIICTGFYLGLHADAVANKNNTDAGMPALMMVFGGIFFAWLSLRRATTITVDKSGIEIRSFFAKKVIGEADILSINNFARGSLGVLRTSSGYGVNGISITTKNLNTVFLPGRYYRNILILKQAVQVNFNGLLIRPPSTEVVSTNSNARDGQAGEKFSGNALFSVHGLAYFVFLLVMFIVMAQTGYLLPFFGVFAISVVVLYFASGNVLNYFIISGNKLIIRNHVWWWRNKQFDISDIEQVVAEHNYHSANSLCINFKNFSTKNFSAGSLRNKTWKALLDKLAAKGVESLLEI